MDTMHYHRFVLLSPLFVLLILVSHLHGASAQDVCGDGVCGATENTYWCARDCGGSCGDGLCSRDESFAECVDCFCTKTEEEELHDLISRYRVENGLPRVPLGVGMSRVAQTHARDSSVSTTAGGPCNQHSWSTSFFDNLSWGGCCYTRDNAQATCMFDKPSQISNLATFGFEISAQGFTSVSAALGGWQQSNVHNDVILNLNAWSRFTWRYMGVGVDPQARWYHVWFYSEADDTEKATECVNPPGTANPDTGITPTPSTSMVTGGGIADLGMVPTPTSSPSMSASASMSSSMMPSAMMSMSPAASNSVIPTVTASVTSTMTPSVSMPASMVPTATSTGTLTATPTRSPTATVSVSVSVSPTVSSGNVDGPVPPKKFLPDGRCNPNYLKVSVVVDPHDEHGGHLLEGHLWTGDLSKVDPHKIISLRPLPYTAFHMISPHSHFDDNAHLFDIVRMNGKNKNKKNKNKKNKNKKNKNKNKNNKNKKNKGKKNKNKNNKGKKNKDKKNKNKNKNKKDQKKEIEIEKKKEIEIQKKKELELELELEEELEFEQEKNKKKKNNNNEDKAAKVYLVFELCGQRFITVKYYQANSQVYVRHVERKTNVYSGIARDNLTKAVHTVFGNTLTFKSWYHSFIRVELFLDTGVFAPKAATFKLETTTH